MRRRAAAEMENLGASVPSANAPVSSLSGGQRQAVAIARSLIWGRRLLIMDEPTAALGPRQTDFVLRLIRRVRDEQNLSVLLITHNLPDVFAVADRVTVLRLGERVMTCPIADATTESLFEAITGAAYAHDLPR
jgi:ABC-type sugar transport system ATPase subunit